MSACTVHFGNTMENLLGFQDVVSELRCRQEKKTLHCNEIVIAIAVCSAPVE